MHNVVDEPAAVNAGSLPEFRKSFETVRKASYLVGVALFTQESDLNVRFFGTSTIIALVYGCCLYSGWFLRSDWNRLLELSTVRKASYMIGIDTSTPERDTNIRIIGSNLFLMALYVVCLYSASTSLQEFRNSFETVRKVTYMVGINVFTLEPDLNVRFFGSAMFMALIYVLCFYTGWVLREAEGYRILEMVMILVLNAQGTNKMWIGFVHKPRYCRLFQSSEQIYESFDSDERNRPVLRDLVAKMNLLLKWIVIVYASSGLLIVVLVALYAIVAREKFLALTIIVPFVDHTSLTGYLIVYLTHMAMAAFCAIGYLASDTAFIVTVVPIIAYANSLQNEIRNFNLLLQAPERDETLIAEKLLRICHLHQMIDEFEQEAIAHFKGGCLVQVALQAGTLLLTIFLAYICGYVQALSIFMALIFQLTQYCALGTIVTAKNDQMIHDIYEIGWHRLDKPQQQMVAFMLHRAQNAKELSVGGVAPLNLVTYVQNEQITADIYGIGWNLLQKPQQKMVAFMLHRAQMARDLTVGQVAPLNMVTYVKIMKTMYSFFAMLVTVMG
ncbi:hypothetical protein quinque_001251 [Culex quinquefasciatus]